ncbi:phosphinothricin acetyltransferase protein [Salinisphaera shabanensis E1L3A]|uniref:Phosphinothricin acetyltransferase protein n=2 Tax=Salinisphaera shabanensis TaxID=180542 RepID=U2E8N0_9GAMM|nr:GNAT family N-acetyltransferase [Salinisphaera shabanensis]ERJ20051.1 phosphinothricin acetyltransferase protein [Salinisphaera shabanensis E1L3A]
MADPVFRTARAEDLDALVQLLADDALGATRECPSYPLPTSYNRAFAAIDADANNELIVAEQDGEIAGMLQLTYIPYLTYRGSWRALVEGVRVADSRRGQGLGRKLFEWAIERSRERGCRLIQLTTDKQRPDALRFYESLGFVASHEGLKRTLAN